MKSSFCIDLQRFMLIHTKFPLTRHSSHILSIIKADRCLLKKRYLSAYISVFFSYLSVFIHSIAAAERILLKIVDK